MTDHETVRSLAGDDAILSDAELCIMKNISRTTLWRKRQRGEAPAVVRLSDRRHGTRLGDARKWLQPET